MAKLFIPSVRCPVCSHANRSDFRFCQRWGYQRRVLTSATTKPPSVDLASISNRLQQLLNFDQAERFIAERIGSIFVRSTRACFSSHGDPPRFVVSLFLRTRMAGLRFTVMVVNLLVKGVNILAVAHFGYYIILSIHILGS